MSHDQQHLEDLKKLVEQGGKDALADAMQYLSTHRKDYHWVGIYKLEGDTLVLGPYVGPTTDHVRIPVGRGVCGTAVAENKNQVVPDVRELDNYLACNLQTRSEIVVLIREPGTGRILGQIDVDGQAVNAFGKEEEGFLTNVAELLAPHLA
jgi:L-methionine (R)-S-oxide reductase